MDEGLTELTEIKNTAAAKAMACVAVRSVACDTARFGRCEFWDLQWLEFKVVCAFHLCWHLIYYDSFTANDFSLALQFEHVENRYC